jgi:hypothetical protein
VKDQFGLEDIQRRRLKVATLNYLNDPFELLGYSGRSRKLRRAFLETKDELATKYGLLCFSEIWTNPVQWSHYASGHRGLCLGFEIPSQVLQKVEYREGRLEPDERVLSTSSAQAEESMRCLLCTKYLHWSYESEWRQWVSLDDAEKEGGFYFWPFSEHLKLVKVIVGHCSSVSRSKLKETLGKLAPEVTQFKARLAFNSFTVTRQNNKKLW